MADELSKAYPQGREQFHDNLEKFEDKLTKLDEELTGILSNASLPFMTMHDAYQGFSKRYKLNYIGAVLDAHAHQISAKDIQRTRKLLREAGKACMFVEPQLSQRPVDTIKEGLDVKIDRADILGAKFAAGKESYFETMRDLGRVLASCLTP